MVDPASQLLQHYSSRISLAILSEESVVQLHTEGLISIETLVEVKSCGHSLLDDTMREIYTAVSDDNNKLRAFANVLFKTKETISIANGLLNNCGKSITTIGRNTCTINSLLDEVTLMSDSMSDISDDPIEQAITPVSGIKIIIINIKIVL